MSSDKFGPGTAIVVKFSRDTNAPPVLSRSQLSKIINFSPEDLNDVPTIGLWDDYRTLAIVFPTGAFYSGGTAPVKTQDVELSFTANNRGTVAVLAFSSN